MAFQASDLGQRRITSQLVMVEMKEFNYVIHLKCLALCLIVGCSNFVMEESSHILATFLLHFGIRMTSITFHHALEAMVYVLPPCSFVV